MTSHKWANEIKAWADGAEIQYRIKPRVEGGEYSEWVTQKNPQWYVSDVAEYRVKPDPAKDVPTRPEGAGCEYCTDPDGTRREARVGQPMRHVKTGGRYVLTAFVIRESDMQQGFDYYSMRTGETFWRPIQELFDGRFEFITMEELCSTS